MFNNSVKRGMTLRSAGLIASLILSLAQFPASASGVVVALSDGAGTTDAGSGGDTEITTTWTSSGLYATNSSIIFTLSPAATSTIANCLAANWDLKFNDSAVGSDGTFATTSFTPTSATWNFVQSVPTSTAGSLCLYYPLSATSATNYSIAIVTDTASATTTTAIDFGASLYYVLGANQVTISATVPAILSFSIRNPNDNGTTSTCPFGTLSPTAVTFCSYRLRIATNAANGFNSTIRADLDFASNGDATMTGILNDTTFTTGTEAYGIAFLVGAQSGVRSATSGGFYAPVVESGGAGYTTTSFNADSSPVPTSTNGVLFVYATSAMNPGSPPSTSSTTLVVHGAAISNGTPAGNYSQTVTYLVTGSF